MIVLSVRGDGRAGLVAGQILNRSDVRIPTLILPEPLPSSDLRHILDALKILSQT